MTNKPLSRLESSLPLDELLVLNDRRHPPNWLLTYLDVFVLIVMLVVTLVALSRFDPATERSEPPLNKASAKHFTEPDTGKINLPGETVTPDVPAQPDKLPAPENISPVNAPERDVANAPQAPETNFAQKRLESSPATQPTAPFGEQKKNPITVPATDGSTNENDPPDLQLHLQERLKKLGLADSIGMTMSQGYAQLEIQDKILYRSSEAQLTDGGVSVLTRLTPLLKESSGLIYIEGHTDNRPIRTTQFPSNWELGAARATSVLHFLADQHIDASRMRAVTYGSSKPVAKNDTEQGRQKNRRVNIIIKVSDDSN